MRDCIVKKNVEMRRMTSFKIGGTAEILIEPESVEEIAEVVRELKGEKYRVFGNGSNLLVSDDGVKEKVIHLGRAFSKIDVDGKCVVAEAGALLSSVANAAKNASLTGLEFAHGIPGSVGGGIRMNAGAYGGEMRDVVKWVEYVSPDGSVFKITNEEADFSYRKSFFTDKNYIISRACFALENGDEKEIAEKMRSLAEKRREKQPLEYPSAGSTFKRPEGYFAAALIEEANLKGERVGGACVSEKHSGFLINDNNASFSDVCELIEKVKKTVFQKSGVVLETEVEIWR
jgi:UDP-N-acetylmuramate dehydrogenase